MELYRRFLAFLAAFLADVIESTREEDPDALATPSTMPATPSNSPQEMTSAPSVPPTPPVPIQSPIDTLLPWDTTGSLSHANWHNVRVICDLKGLDKIQSPNGPFTLKEELCSTVWGESEFEVHAIRHNYAFHADGTRYLASTDNGICQWNDYYHGKEITPEEAQNDPQKSVELMADYFKAGRQYQWVAHLNGSYKLHLGKTL